MDSLVDMTPSLAGATIYIESRYYPGWWIGASDKYNGYIFELSEETVFNPSEPCRLEVVDCNDGFVCLRTRYREYPATMDNSNTSSVMSNHPKLNILSGDDPRSYYLEADDDDVDFSLNTASPADKPDWFKWKIGCTSSDMTQCYIENKYYTGAQVFQHNDRYGKWLDTKYREPGDEDIWYQHRIMNPKFTEVSREVL